MSTFEFTFAVVPLTVNVVVVTSAVVPDRSKSVASIFTFAASKSTLAFTSNVVPSIVKVVLVIFADVPDISNLVAAMFTFAASKSTLAFTSKFTAIYIFTFIF